LKAPVNVKEAILVAGQELLRESGVAALTQPKVARAAGIKQSHLTYYFPTRAKLLLGIAEYTASEAMAHVAERLAAKPERATLAGMVSEIMINGLPPRVVIGLIVAADAEPGIRDSLRELVSNVRARLQSLLAAAGLAASADAALLFHATVVGLAVMHQARMSPASAAEVDNGVASMLRLLALPVHDIGGERP
jgi:AcrR family transcriptional regulator